MKSEKVYVEFLVLKAQAGEQSAWDALLPLVQVKIKAFVRKFMGDSAGADDCIQETLLSVFSKLRQLKNLKLFHTWIYRIAYSKCMDFGRKQIPGSEVDDLRAEDMSAYDQEIDVKSAIVKLPEEQQVIIYLFYYEGFNVTEIASVLSKPAGTIKYLLFTARESLKQRLTTQPEQESNL